MSRGRLTPRHRLFCLLLHFVKMAVRRLFADHCHTWRGPLPLSHLVFSGGGLRKVHKGGRRGARPLQQIWAPLRLCLMIAGFFNITPAATVSSNGNQPAPVLCFACLGQLKSTAWRPAALLHTERQQEISRKRWKKVGIFFSSKLSAVRFEKRKSITNR